MTIIFLNFSSGINGLLFLVEFIVQAYLSLISNIDIIIIIIMVDKCGLIYFI